MTQPRQIYASAADRRSGRRWGSRRRSAWLPATALAAAAVLTAVLGELLRGV